MTDELLAKAREIADPDRVHCEHYSRGMLTAGANRMLCRALINPVKAYCGGESFGWVNKAPCFQRSGAEVCPKAEYPTPEQVAQRKAASDADMRRALTALAVLRPAMVAHHKATGENGGEMDCPECKRASGVQWSRSTVNGHIHARCQTPDCIGWME